MPLFLLFPTVAVIVPILTHLELPDAIMIFEGTSKILRNWKFLTSMYPSSQRKYYLRKLKAIRPSRFHASLAGFNLYKLKHCTKSTYYFTTLKNTIDALVSIPQSVVPDFISFD
jgi:hypothetical protein